MSKNLKLFALSLALAGCGSSADLPTFVQSNASVPNTVTAAVSAARGGTLTHPATGHTVQLAPLALNGDANVSLTLVDSNTVTPRDEREFDPVGTALRLDVPGGVSGQVSFTVPYTTNRPQVHRLYWQAPAGLLFPLQTQYNSSSSSFTGTLSLQEAQIFAQAAGEPRAQLSSSSFIVALVDETQYASRPPHVDWPSYNLYQFQNGSFVKIVNQGVPVSALPDPGAKPLMIVHGLGSTAQRFQDAATFMQNSTQAGFTGIFAFEYDTLSGLQTTGPKLDQAYLAIEKDPTKNWYHLAHSMGTLVSRTAFEGGPEAPYASNSVAFAAGPHLGSTFVNALQGNLDLFQRAIRYLVVNEVMDFTNADGTPCQVDLNSAGFNDLAAGNPTLAALNANAAQHHPKETYRTAGGNSPGVEFDLADFLVGVYPDDGLVFLTSANASVIGAVKSDTVAESHTTIVDSPESLTLLLNDLLAGSP